MYRLGGIFSSIKHSYIEAQCCALSLSCFAAVVICATCSEVASLPACLRTPGRLDATVVLPPPGTAGRAGMLAAELGARGLSFAPEDLQVIGSFLFCCSRTAVARERLCNHSPFAVTEPGYLGAQLHAVLWSNFRLKSFRALSVGP